LILNQRQYWYSAPSDTTRKSNNTEKNSNSDTYEKMKETKMNEATGKMRIYFQLRTTNDATRAYAKIYKNGGAIGTERSTISETYVAFTEDLGGFNADDLIQIYVKSQVGAGSAWVCNFRFKYDRAVSIAAGHELATGLPTVDQTIFSMTNTPGY